MKTRKQIKKAVSENGRLVLIEWVDSHYRPGWTTESNENWLPLKCISVGWMVHDGKEAKVITAHVSVEGTPQRCGDMTIPTAAIVSIRDVF